MLLKVDCLPNAVGKQLSIPLISARVSGVFGVKNAEKLGPDAKKLGIGSH